MKKVLVLLSLMNVNLAAHAGGWSIGIPGVGCINCNGNGGFLQVGPGSAGTNIPTPNCGGDICNGLEHAKNELTGENSRKAAQADAEQAARELAAANSALQATNNEIDRIKEDKKKQMESLSVYKRNLVEGARQFHNQAEVFERDQQALQQLLTLALKQTESIGRSSAVLKGQAKQAAENLRAALQGIGQEPAVERDVVLASIEMVALKANPTDEVKRAVENTATAARTMETFLAQGLSALSSLDSIFGAPFVDYLNGVLAGLNGEMEFSKNLVKSVVQITKNVDEMSAQASTTN